MSEQPKIGLALGAGAARGLAHIGVLKVLEAERIKVSAIAGTSIGAFIGALYAAGVSVDQIEKVARDVDWPHLFTLVDPILPTSGLIDGKKVVDLMSRLLPVHTFEELRLPLAITATDIETGDALTIKKGNLVEALRAAIAFPGIFTPVRFGDRFLVDGGLCNPVPADVVRAMGAQLIIGVCVIPQVEKKEHEAYLPAVVTPQPETAGKSFLERLASAGLGIEKLLQEVWGSDDDESSPPQENNYKAKKPPGILKVCAQSVAIMENQINNLRLEKVGIDVLIRPPLTQMTLLEFHRAAEAITAGEAAARSALPEIRKQLASIASPSPCVKL